MPGADRVMTTSDTVLEPDPSGPQTSRSGSPDPEAQASSGGEPAARPTTFQESVPETLDSTPMDAQVPLARSFMMVAMAGESLDADPAVYYHQGSDFVLLGMLKNQLAYLPDLSDLRPEANIDDAIVRETGESDPEEEERLRAILRKHRTIFLGEGNALPPPARGVVCDLDVGDAKPISMRSRRFPLTYYPTCMSCSSVSWKRG
ncbi:Eukaryotic/viral aspartic protease [Phytophthora megakarya]|uniref:Eukaryotic/viral aspartic protease n=1 Tax=Phytophthora megakarya TaxID=4795 RepID=A0A225WTM3_9STRA|nr:Eukaryotic/viral aspartic protease [Phytophthora megakarya]